MIHCVPFPGRMREKRKEIQTMVEYKFETQMLFEGHELDEGALNE